MALKPVPISNTDLGEMLREMAQGVEDFDSFDGSITYSAYDGPLCTGCKGESTRQFDSDGLEVCPRCGGFAVEPLPEGKDFWVHGVYRVGNSMGQGGVRMVGEVQS